MYLLHDLLRKAEQVGQTPDLVADQHRVGGFHGDVRPDPAHGDAGVCGCEGEGVVDAVADHADRLCAACAAPDDVHFILRQEIGPDVRNPHAARDGGRGMLIVAGEQHQRDADGFQPFHRCFGVFTQRVAQGKISDEMPVRCHVYHRRALVAFGLAGGFTGAGVDALRAYEAFFSCQNRFPAHNARNALSGDYPEMLHGLDFTAALFIGGPDGPAKRVLGLLLRERGDAQDIRIGICFGDGDGSRHLRLSVSQRAGFVKGHTPDFRQTLQRVSGADDHAVFRCVSDSGEDRRRRGQDEGAGAENDQHSYRSHKLAGYDPGDDCTGQGDQDEPGCPAVCRCDDRCLVFLGLPGQANHSLQGAVCTDGIGAHRKRAELIDRAAENRIPRGFIHGKALSGHNGLVDGGFPLQNCAVHRDRFSGQHAEHVANLNLLDRDFDRRAAAQHTGGLRREVDQLFDALPRFCRGVVLQKRSDLHNQGYLAGGEKLLRRHGSDQRKRYQQVGLDIVRKDDAPKGADQDRHAAHDDGDPRNIEGQ